MTKFILKIFCIVFILQSNLIWAQTRTISGTVFEGLSKNPIQGLTIEVKGVKQTVQTSSEGEFSLQVPDTMQTINFADFATMTIMEVKQIAEDEFNIYLTDGDFINLINLSLEDLLKIKVVTAGKQEQKISDIPASVVVISKADIEAYGYQSLKEILSNVLGMYKIDDFRNVSFGVRGFFSNVYSRNIIFMVNGVKQQQPYQNWNDLNLMNLQVEEIERIEIVRGPAAIIYGNDAFFGAINIITHKNAKDIKSSLTTSYASNNTFRSNIQINSATKKTKVNFSAGYYNTDGRAIPFAPILDSVRRYDNTWVKNGNTKGYFEQTSSFLNLNIAHNGFYANLSYDETARNFISVFSPIYDTTKLDRKEQIMRGKIGYHKELNASFTLDIGANIESWQTNNSYNEALVIPATKYGLGLSQAKSFCTELIMFIKPSRKFNIILGCNYKHTYLGYQLNDIPSTGLSRNFEILHSPNNTYAAFTQVEYALTSKINISAGCRAEKQSPYDYKNVRYVSNIYKDTIYRYTYDKLLLIPKLALVYNINDKNVLKLMYGQAISRPGLTENSILSWDTKSPTLEPQTIATSELNFNTSPLHNISINFGAFYNTLDKLINRIISTDPSNGKVNTSNRNSGKMRTFGGEMSINYKPINQLMLDVSFTYQKTQNEIFNNEAAYSPQLLAYFKAIYTIKNNIVLAFNSYFVGSMESDWDDIKKARISKTTPSYFNLASNIRFNNIFMSQFYISLHADNILNNKIFYAPTSVNKSYLSKGTYDTGIETHFVLGLKF